MSQAREGFEISLWEIWGRVGHEYHSPVYSTPEEWHITNRFRAWKLLGLIVDQFKMLEFSIVFPDTLVKARGRQSFCISEPILAHTVDRKLVIIYIHHYPWRVVGTCIIWINFNPHHLSKHIVVVYLTRIRSFTGRPRTQKRKYY